MHAPGLSSLSHIARHGHTLAPAHDFPLGHSASLQHASSTGTLHTPFTHGVYDSSPQSKSCWQQPPVGAMHQPSSSSWWQSRPQAHTLAPVQSPNWQSESIQQRSVGGIARQTPETQFIGWGGPSSGPPGS